MKMKRNSLFLLLPTTLILCEEHFSFDDYEGGVLTFGSQETRQKNIIYTRSVIRSEELGLILLQCPWQELCSYYDPIGAMLGKPSREKLAFQLGMKSSFEAKCAPKKACNLLKRKKFRAFITSPTFESMLDRFDHSKGPINNFARTKYKSASTFGFLHRLVCSDYFIISSLSFYP